MFANKWNTRALVSFSFRDDERSLIAPWSSWALCYQTLDLIKFSIFVGSYYTWTSSGEGQQCLLLDRSRSPGFCFARLLISWSFGKREKQLLLTVHIGVSVLGAFPAPSPGYTGGKKETQGAHWHIAS